VSSQDGLLSFQIRETIFLSSDKAGMEEMRELELLPDVEIIENTHDISITGCLQLFGRYKPTRNAKTSSEGGTDSLVAAMKFTPFPLDGEQLPDFALDPDVELSHRIPLSISIPLERVAQVEEIYAIVDGFDYEIKGPSHLQIEAELKISGIKMQEEKTVQKENTEEVWEYVHVTDQEESPVYDTASIEEIERKLAALEKEVEEQLQQEEETRPDHRFFPSAPHVYYPSPAETFTSFSREETPAVPPPPPPSPLIEEVIAEKQDEPEVEETVEVIPVTAKEEVPGSNIIDFQEVYEERYGESQTVLSEEEKAVEEVHAIAEEASEEAKEMKVAISTKPAKEKTEGLNLTRILTNAGRSQVQEGEQAIKPKDRESSSFHAERQSSESESYKATLDAVNNLSSFARGSGEQFKKVKMCIIQRNDTLEKIAERYSLPVSKILEVNSLTTDRIEEGQVLYIPQ